MDESAKRKLIIKVAKLYYLGNMTQEDISGMLGISRSKVSRLLTAAHQYNIVQVTIKDPQFDYSAVAAKICSYYNLNKVIVVPAGQNAEEAKANIGAAASDFLNSSMTKSSNIAIGWGTTLSAFVHRFQAEHKWPDAKVVQISGGTYSREMHMDCRELVQTMARKMGASGRVLQLPMFVHSPELQKLMMAEPETQEHFKLFKHIDMAFVGIGDSNYKESVAYKTHYLNMEQAKTLYRNGMCDLCGHFLTIEGEEADTEYNECVISIPLEDLKRIPVVVGLCAGNSKATSIKAVLTGGLVNTLIIDEIAAISLMEMEGLSY